VTFLLASSFETGGEIEKGKATVLSHVFRKKGEQKGKGKRPLRGRGNRRRKKLDN